MTGAKKQKEINFADISEYSTKKSAKHTIGKKTKFFSSHKSKPNEKIKSKNMNNKSQPISIYRKISITFVALTIILALVVVYFSIVSVKIIIIPNKERINTDFIATVIDKSANQQIKGLSLTGLVERADIDIEQQFQTAGKEVKEAKVSGLVTIYNKRNSEQALIKTTRLLSPDEKLYRLQETVRVPAGGKVENVAIYADKAEKSMEVGAVKFTIPGLSPSAQELVYAESSEKTLYQEIGDAVVSELDLANAKESLKNVLMEKLAKISEDNKYQEYDNVIYNIGDSQIQYSSSASVGDKIDKFTVSAKAQAAIVAFNTKDVEAVAKLKLEESLPDDKQVSSFDENNFTFAFDRYDLDSAIADLKVEAVAQMILKDGTDIINPDKLVGLTREQLDDYLSSLREVAGYEIKFTPNWISKVPGLVDHIKVEVAK